MLALIGLAIGTAVSAAEGWLVMVILGSLHTAYPQVPAAPFWAAWLVVILANLLFGNRGSSK